MCDRCKALQIENARLRDLLELRYRADVFGRLRAAFLLTEQQSRVLMRLYRERGGLVAYDLLWRELPLRYRRTEGDNRAANFVRVVIHQMRAKLPPDTIRTQRGFGVCLTLKGEGAVTEALKGDFMSVRAA